MSYGIRRSSWYAGEPSKKEALLAVRRGVVEPCRTKRASSKTCPSQNSKIPEIPRSKPVSTCSSHTSGYIDFCPSPFPSRRQADHVQTDLTPEVCGGGKSSVTRVPLPIPRSKSIMNVGGRRREKGPDTPTPCDALDRQIRNSQSSQSWEIKDAKIGKSRTDCSRNAITEYQNP